MFIRYIYNTNHLELSGQCFKCDLQLDNGIRYLITGFLFNGLFHEENMHNIHVHSIPTYDIFDTPLTTIYACTFTINLTMLSYMCLCT